MTVTVSVTFTQFSMLKFQGDALSLTWIFLFKLLVLFWLKPADLWTIPLPNHVFNNYTTKLTRNWDKNGFKTITTWLVILAKIVDVFSFYIGFINCNWSLFRDFCAVIVLLKSHNWTTTCSQIIHNKSYLSYWGFHCVLCRFVEYIYSSWFSTELPGRPHCDISQAKVVPTGARHLTHVVETTTINNDHAHLLTALKILLFHYMSIHVSKHLKQKLFKIF